MFEEVVRRGCSRKLKVVQELEGLFRKLRGCSRRLFEEVACSAISAHLCELCG
jgi:hypothetical protein